MAETVVYVPHIFMSRRGCEMAPALRAAVHELGNHFDVQVFTWFDKTHHSDEPPTIDWHVRTLREAMPRGCHVIASRSSAPEAIAAVSDPTHAASFVCDGLVPGAATMAALKHSTEMLTAAVDMALSGTYHFYRRMLQGASDEEAARYPKENDAAVDLPRMVAGMRLCGEWNMAEQRPRITVPALYLEYPPEMEVEGTRELFLRIAPQAEVQRLSTWGSRLHDPETAGDFSGRVIEFIERVRGRAAVATILFTDIVGSTERAAELGDVEWGRLRSAHHSLVRSELASHGGKEVETAGDAFLATFDGPTDALSCALSIGRGIEMLGLHVRAGVHTGECKVAGGKVEGLAVHIAARVAGLAGSGEVMVSDTVRQLLTGSKFEFADRGSHELKGVPGEWRLFAAHEAK